MQSMECVEAVCESENFPVEEKRQFLELIQKHLSPGGYIYKSHIIIMLCVLVIQLLGVS